MFTKKIIFFPLLITLLLSVSMFSQEKELGTEVVNIVKPYSPTISDAFKVKETPVLEDSVAVKKKNVEYSIYSVPVASTFTPAKGKATTVEKAKREKLYDNYATVGIGNYTTLLGELYSNFEISRSENVGFFFKHNSSQGKIKNIELDNKYYDTRLDGHYTNREKNMTYTLEAGFEHQLYNWYGLPYREFYPTVIENIDPAHSYFGGHVGGNIALANSFFERGSVNFRYLGDSFSSSEYNLKLVPEFAFPLESLTARVVGDIDYLNGSFKRNYSNTESISYSYLNLGVTPSFNYADDDLSLTLGVAGYVIMDTENSETDFSLYPKIDASYRLDEALIVYGGVDGGITQNSYYNFKEENPFVSPTLYVAPTKNVFNAFGGLKGKLTNMIGYNVKAAYGKDDHKPLFLLNEAISTNPESRGYEYGNSFQVVYDDINTLNISGELKVEISDMVSGGIQVDFYSYNTDSQKEAWNLPNIKASLFSEFNITEQLYGGASLFYVGERKDLEYFNSSFYEPEVVNLKGYLDANLHFGYRVTDRLSFFIKGNNLLNDNYKKWSQYPVQGIQALLGATYKFDW